MHDPNLHLFVDDREVHLLIHLRAAVLTESG
jgi:hypothetical protein